MASKIHIATIGLKSGKTVQVAVTKFKSSQIDDPKTGKSNYNLIEWGLVDTATHKQLKSDKYPNITRLSSINCSQVESIEVEEMA